MRLLALPLALLVVLTPSMGARPALSTTAIRELTDAASAVADLDRIHSLLVSWRGSLVVERGLIKGVKQPIADYFPSLRAQKADERKQQITIEDLLTMRAGLESTSSRGYGAWVQSPNWVQYALNRPIIAEPGTYMDYSTGSTHLLSAILTKATGKSTWQFAQETLARPLGFSLAQWPRDPQGVYFGGNDMLLTPRQMVSLAETYSNRGSFGGRQIVPAAWVDASWVIRARSRWSDQFYGYGWWARELADRDVRYAWGFGGAIHLRRARSRPRRRDHLSVDCRRIAAESSTDGVRHHRADGDRADCADVVMRGTPVGPDRKTRSPSRATAYARPSGTVRTAR